MSLEEFLDSLPKSVTIAYVHEPADIWGVELPSNIKNWLMENDYAKSQAHYKHISIRKML